MFFENVELLLRVIPLPILLPGDLPCDLPKIESINGLEKEIEDGHEVTDLVAGLEADLEVNLIPTE